MIRLLTPSDFGVYVTPFIIFSLARTLQDLGTTNIVYTSNNISLNLRREILGFNIITTLFFGLMLITISPYLVNYWTKSEISKNIMFWLGISYFFTTPMLVHDSWLKSELQFKKLFIINIITTIISTTVGLYVANENGESMSLVIKHLVYCTLGFPLYIGLYGNIVIPKFKFIELRKYTNFTHPLIILQTLNFFSRNIDNLLINRYMGVSILGIYERCYRLLTFPIEQVSGSISKVLLPGLTKYNDNSVVQKDLISLVINITFIIGVPISTILLIWTKEFVQIVFGIKWLEMIPLLKIFSILLLFQSQTVTLYNLFLIKKETFTPMILNILSFPINLTIYIIFTVYYPNLNLLVFCYSLFSILMSFVFWYKSLKLINQNLILIAESLAKSLGPVIIYISWNLFLKNFSSLQQETGLEVLGVTFSTVVYFIYFLFTYRKISIDYFSQDH